MLSLFWWYIKFCYFICFIFFFFIFCFTYRSYFISLFISSSISCCFCTFFNNKQLLQHLFSFLLHYPLISYQSYQYIFLRMIKKPYPSTYFFFMVQLNISFIPVPIINIIFTLSSIFLIFHIFY